MKSVSILIAFGLAFWAFRRDAKTNPYPNAALWLPTLWMMRCGSRSIDAWISGGEGGRWDPVMLAGLIVGAWIVLARRPAKWGSVVAANSMLFVFYSYLIISVSWAEALQSPLTKVIRPLGDLLLALMLITEPDPGRAIMTVFRRTAILLIPLSLALAMYFPDLGRGQNKGGGADFWIGITTHKNPLGQLCMVAAFAFLWELAATVRRGEKLFRPSVTWLYLALTCKLMIFGTPGSRSSTSIFCLILACGMFVIFGLMRERLPLLIRSIVAGILFLGIFSALLDFFGTSLQAFVAGLNGKDPTLTDRTYLWRDVIRIGMMRPVLGSGYGGFWTDQLYDMLSPEVDNFPAQAHNGYLETFAELGGVGLVLLACAIVQTLVNATKMIQNDYEYGRIRLVLLFTILVMNWSEASFPRGTHLWWFGFLVIALYARPWIAWPEEDYAEEEEEAPAIEAEAIEDKTPA